MSSRILLTGSAGVIGGALRAALESEGALVIGLDLRAHGHERGDVRDQSAVERAARGCTGIVHLAAVSRVAWAERDPAACHDTNVLGTRSVVAAALAQRQAPWLVLGSSREVYGNPDSLPVTEAAPFRPVNVYGRSKAEGEAIVSQAREKGLRAAILRFSNVYGSPLDHADRVVPAFVRAALEGGRLRVHGAGSSHDFTHVDDTVRGIVALVRLLSRGAAAPPPVHLTTGQGTTLESLARLIVELSGTAATIERGPQRAFDVARFHGDPSRAKALLGWAPRVSLRDGLVRLVETFRRDLAPAGPRVSAS
jgi:nucleoside-diphosphate-sugar epimerase